MYAVVDGDNKTPLPRYFKERIYSKEEREQEGWLNLQRIRQEEEKARGLNPTYDRDKQESIKQAYRTMYKKATKNRK